MPAVVRTVDGDMAPSDLGATYCHEHLITDPAPRLVGPDRDLVLDDEDRALQELRTFREAGGGCLVEVSTPEFGRDLDALQRLSRASGVKIVAATGHVSEDYWRGVIPLEDVAPVELEAEFIRDVAVGTERHVRAGVIKVGSSLDEVTEFEERIFRAAARAQSQLGVPITTHTTAGTAALEQVAILRDAGVDLAKVCIGHLDRKLDWDYHCAIADSGVYLGFDCMSKEQYQPEALRIEFIRRLIDRGVGDRILLSGDFARRSYLEAWGGGPGYRYILESVTQLLLSGGVSEDAVRDLLMANPQRFLAFEQPQA